MKKRILTLIGVMLLGLLPYSGGTAGAVTDDAVVYILHGIPGQGIAVDFSLPMDVSINGMRSLPSIGFGGLIGPMNLQPGTYTIGIHPASYTNSLLNSPILLVNVSIAAGETVVIAVYLAADGTPTVGKFPVDISEPNRGEVRLIAHHLAAAPPATLALRKSKRWRNVIRTPLLANGEQVTMSLKQGRWTGVVIPEGNGYILYENNRIHLKSRTVVCTFAVGSVASGTFTVLVVPLS